MYSGDELWRPLKLFPSNLTDIQKEEKFTELEFKTLNRMIEDWTIIDDITKCLYGEPFKVNNFMSLSDYYQLRVNRWILDQQHRIMMETYSNEKERVILDIKPTILEELRRQL